MREIRLLVLTDHRKHSDQNSLYALVRALHSLEVFADIDIASRGNKENENALIRLNSQILSVHSSAPDFYFSTINPPLEQGLHKAKLSDYDFIFLRIPRPLPDGFFKYLLNCLPANRIFNNPLGIEKTGSKDYLLNFPELIPPSRICHSPEDIQAFAKAYDTVIKPLKDYGGHGIVRLNKSGFWNGNKQLERSMATEYFASIDYPVLAMKFLENVHKGDKRIVMAGDKLLLSTLRIPGEDNWLCNVAQGGKAVSTTVTDREREIIRKISEAVTDEGIVLYGIDTLEDADGLRYLSEINTLSIGGIGPAEELTGKPVARIAAVELWNAMQSTIK